SAYDSYPRPHDRNDQQADPHFAAARTGTGTRTNVRRNCQADGHSRRESQKSSEDRTGTHLSRNANRRRGRFASGRFHRRPRGRVSGRGCDQRQLERPDFAGTAHADTARRKSHQDAFWPRRRQRAYARRSGPIVRGDTRTHSPDRSEGAAEAATSIALAEVAGVYGWCPGLKSFHHRDAESRGKQRKGARFDRAFFFVDRSFEHYLCQASLAECKWHLCGMTRYLPT